MVDHVVRAVPAQPGHAVRPHRVLHPRPPAQPRVRLPVSGPLAPGPLAPGQGLDRDPAVQAATPLELLPDHGRLELPLGGQCGVLPVAANRQADRGPPSVPAGRLHPVR